MKPKIQEKDLAAPATRFLQELGFEVFHEVAPWGGGARRADIVGLKKTPNGATLVYVIELKVALGTAVLDQAMDWVGRVNWVSVGTPSSRGTAVSRHILRHFGIGHLQLSLTEYDRNAGLDCSVAEVPRFVRKADQARVVAAACVPETAAAGAVLAAGSNGGGFSTPFNRTIRQLRDVVEKHERINGEPVLFKTAVSSIQHHYRKDSTANSTLAQWMRTGSIKGLRPVIIGGKLHVTAKPDEPVALRSA